MEMGLTLYKRTQLLLNTSQITEEALSARKLMEMERVMCHCHLHLLPSSLESRDLQDRSSIVGEGTNKYHH